MILTNTYMETFYQLKMNFICQICHFFHRSVFINYNMSQGTVNCTTWHVRPAKTKIILRSHSVWPEYWLTTQWAPSRDSDQAAWICWLVWVFTGLTYQVPVHLSQYGSGFFFSRIQGLAVKNMAVKTAPSFSCWFEPVKASRSVLLHAMWLILTLENHCSRTAQSSCFGCSRQGHKYTILVNYDPFYEQVLYNNYFSFGIIT